MNKIVPLVIFCLLLACGFTAMAEPAATKKKPPAGVPADAQLFNGKWYKVYLEPCNWERARERCSILGGHLVVASDEPTWAFVRPLTQGLALWMGATDEKTEGLWMWLDGTPMKFKAWHRRQPDNAGGREHYLQTVGNAWNDMPKDAKLVGFICEWKDR